MNKRICSIEGCGKSHNSRGWCQMHYTRWKRYGDPLAYKQLQGFNVARLMEKVDFAPSGCWLWLGPVGGKGYGQFRLDGKLRPAHAASYMIHLGAVPDGLELDHLCRVRRCVNPEHLEPVTHAENLLRGNTIAAANAAKTHCLNGHAFTEQNTYVTSVGQRRCRTCQKITRRVHFLRTGR